MFGWIRNFFGKTENKAQAARERVKGKITPELYAIVSKQLNDEQIVAYDNLMYFLDDSFSKHHRERVLAMFFLTQAIKCKENATFVFHHHCDEFPRKEIVDLLKRIMVNYPDVGKHLVYYESSIMWTGK